jgi:hypothetical protein
MAEELATLADALMDGEKASAPVSEETPEVKAEASVPSTPTVNETAVREAAELGQILIDSGYNRSQINQLLEAPTALESIRSLLQNNPQEFLNMLERSDPQAHEKLLETGADRFVDRYGTKDKPAGKHADSETDLRMRSMQEKIDRLEAEENRRVQAAQLASATSRYEARVKDLLETKEIKELGLTNAEVKALKARLNTELAADPAIARRVTNGNFVDVPRAFKGLIDEWASDRRTAVESAKAQRERSEKGAFAEYQGGPNPFMLDIPKGAADSWDSTELEFAKALDRSK